MKNNLLIKAVIFLLCFFNALFALDVEVNAGKNTVFKGEINSNTIKYIKKIPNDKCLTYIEDSNAEIDLYTQKPYRFILDDFNYINGFHQLILDLGYNRLYKTEFSIYPNPVTDILNLEAQETINFVSISNVLGQVLFNSNVDALETSIDLSSYAKGTYFVKVQIGNSVITKKIIKE